MVAVCILGALFLYRSFPGRFFYAVGGNEEASRLTGINTKLVKVLAYSVCGFFTGLAGIIWLSRVNSGQPTTGNGFEFDVISGIVLGGVSILGGSGDVVGAMLGIIAIGFLNNGLVLINVSEFYQLLIKGLVLLLAISLDSFKRNFHGTFRLSFLRGSKAPSDKRG
jgi:ribose transport system permease protein